jgi:hypothetical protein
MADRASSASIEWQVTNEKGQDMHKQNFLAVAGVSKLLAAMATAAMMMWALGPANAATVADPDHDGLTSSQERNITHTNPFRADTDRDGTKDGNEERDKDGIDNTDEREFHLGMADADTDDDGTEDGDEDRDHDGKDNEDEDDDDLMPRVEDDADEDFDHDDLDDEDENEFGEHERDADTDDDGLVDGLEDEDVSGVDDGDQDDENEDDDHDGIEDTEDPDDDNDGTPDDMDPDS